MKKNKITIFFLAVSFLSMAQPSFEGFVTYKMTPQNPNVQLISDTAFYSRIKGAFGGQLYALQKYHYKNDSYKSEVEMGKIKTFQVFSPTEKKLYTWQNGADSAMIVSSETNLDKVTDIKQMEEEDLVLGIKCKKLVITTESAQTTYWYSPTKYKIDYNLFKTHNYGDWNSYLKIAGALPLKYEVKGKMFHLITTAIEVKEEAVLDTVFDLPKFKH